MRRFGNLVISLVSVLVMLVVFEFGIRVVAPDLAPEPVSGDQYRFYQYDPVLGWAGRPGARGVFARAEFSYPLRLNAAGRRGPDVAVARGPGVRRVAVLGDSFMWGIGAADEALLATRLAAGLGAPGGAEVVNFAVSGYGPVQYLLQTEAVLAMRPDAVVIAFCLGNDFSDNVLWRRYGYYKPYASLAADGGLRMEGTPIPERKRLAGPGWVERHSALARFVTSNWIRVFPEADAGQRGLVALEDGAVMHRDPDGAVAREAVAVNRAIFARIAAAYREAGVPVLVLAVPSKCEFGGCYPDLPGQSRAARDALARSLDGLGVVVVDPTAEFSLADFWEKDGHWRESGHAKAAAALLGPVRAALAGR